MRSLRTLSVAVAALAFAIGLGARPAFSDDKDLKGSAGHFDGTILKIFEHEKLMQVRVDRVPDKSWLEKAKEVASKGLEAGDVVYVHHAGAIQGIEDGNDWKNLKPDMKIRVKHLGRLETMAPKKVREAGGPEKIEAYETEIIYVYKGDALAPAPPK